jgi:hypothetical protein
MADCAQLIDYRAGQYTVRLVKWDRAAAKHAAAANNGDRRFADAFARQAGEGLACLAVERDGKRIGTIGYRLEPAIEGGLDFVILFAASDRPDLDTVADLMATWERLAAAAGCARVRYHTTRPGLVKKGQAAGFEAVEYVMRKEIRACFP